MQPHASRPQRAEHAESRDPGTKALRSTPPVRCCASPGARAKRVGMRCLILPLCLLTAACATAPAPEFSNCNAYAPAFEITDAFMDSFNARDIPRHEGVLHFPHTRIAGGRTTTIPDRGSDWMARAYARLDEQGWRRSAWASREVVQCDDHKAHMLTTFVRYRADGSELSRFDSLYVIEHRNGYWGVSARSSFAE